jgi:hypothetical protein
MHIAFIDLTFEVEYNRFITNKLILKDILEEVDINEKGFR